MRSGMAAWRAMTKADLGAVQAIADALHPDHPERPAVFAERLALAPEGCLTLADRAGAVLGFAVSHPWRGAAPPALDALLGRLPAAPDRWHLHDVALAPAARGQGHVPALLARIAALAAARAIPTIGLVAVGGTERLWARLGFRPAGDGAAGAALASYGPDAIPMQGDALATSYIN